MIITGVFASIFVGILGTGIGVYMQIDQLGTILSIATMGGFIMTYIKKINEG